MSKNSKMSKKVARSMRIAKVAVAGAGTWDFNIPEYLRGKLAEDDVVVVEVPERGADGKTTFALKVGLILSLQPTSPHRPDNVHDVVDKVRVNRWASERKRRDEVAALYMVANERAGELEALRSLRRTADEFADGELADMVDGLEELTGLDASSAFPSSNEGEGVES